MSSPTTTKSIVWGTTVNYLRASSFSGVSHAANAQTTTRAAYWTAIFVVGLGLTARSLSFLIGEFLQYPVTTSVEVVAKKTSDFPAVTVCNLNRINCLNLEAYVSKLHSNITANEDLAKELSELSVSVGCRAQVCDLLGLSLPASRVDKDADEMVVSTKRDLQCQDHFRDKQHLNSLCYHLYLIKEDPSTPAEHKAQAEELWNHNTTQYCELEDTCEIHLVMSSEEDGITEDTFFPDNFTAECIAMDTVEDEGGKKKKKKRRKRRRKRSETSLEAAAASVSNSTSSEATDGGTAAEEISPSSSESCVTPAPFVPTISDTIEEDEFLERYMALSVNVRKEIGHKIETKEFLGLEALKMISYCNFQGNKCTSSMQWILTSTSSYGNCYTFNSAYNDQDEEFPRSNFMTGALNGLNLEMYVDQPLYMAGALSQSAGVRVVVHPPDDHPLVDEMGINVLPGTDTSIALRTKTVSRLPEPYPSDCISHWNQTNLEEGVMSSVRPRYTQSTCQRFCLQHMIMKSCDCFEPQLDMSLMNVTKFDFKSGIRPCNFDAGDDVSDIPCFEGVLETYFLDGGPCDTCHIPCSEVEYSTFTTTSTWPSNRYWTDFALEMGFDPKDVFDVEDNALFRAQIQENYLRLRIFFKTLDVTESVQTAKYTIYTAFGALGGGLSLYLGVAIILLFELLELAYDICSNLRNKRIAKMRTRRARVKAPYLKTLS